MIVDGKGNLIEDRRKKTTERRENDFDAKGGRRQADRRKQTQDVIQNKNKKG